MNKTEQGVQQPNKWGNPLFHVLLLLAFCLTHNVSAEALIATQPENIVNTHTVFNVYAPDNALISNIAKKLSDDLNHKRSDIIVTEITPDEEIKTINDYNDIIVSIGNSGRLIANQHHPSIKKLFISTDPNKYGPDTNKNNATLYMTQSYCRQIKFIRLLNARWKTISILSSKNKPIDTRPIQKCTDKYNFNLYTVHTDIEENQTSKIKDALIHSDVLLALPDRNIYNSKTVKNILLTSYRYRKPVIAFSRNFVNAGALASIHSDTSQIAQSASKIVQQYFDAGQQFESTVNFPESFDININRQVFRALDLEVPDINALKNSLLEKPQDIAEKQL